jgi:hypothetical protein
MAGGDFPKRSQVQRAEALGGQIRRCDVGAAWLDEA